jgi:hypothetical protein
MSYSLKSNLKTEKNKVDEYFFRLFEQPFFGFSALELSLKLEKSISRIIPLGPGSPPCS